MGNGSTVEVGAILGEIGAGTNNIVKIKKEKIKDKTNEEIKEEVTKKPSEESPLILEKPISEKNNKKNVFILDNPIDEEKTQVTSSVTAPS